MTERPWSHDCFGRYALSCHRQALPVKRLLSLHRPMSNYICSNYISVLRCRIVVWKCAKSSSEVMAWGQTNKDAHFGYATTSFCQSLSLSAVSVCSHECSLAHQAQISTPGTSKVLFMSAGASIFELSCSFCRPGMCHILLMGLWVGSPQTLPGFGKCANVRCACCHLALHSCFITSTGALL